MLAKLLDAQYRRPSGFLGRWIGRQMLDQHRPENLWTVSLLAVQPTNHLLEIGFGPGLAIAEVAQRASQGRVAGVDFSPTMVGMARRRNAAAIRAGRVDLRCADVAALPFEDAHFDKAYSIHSIYFCPRPGDALREIQRVLKPGGLLVLTILPKDRWPGGGTGAPDCRPYSGEELQRIMAEAGFAETWIRAGESSACPSNYSILGDFIPALRWGRGDIAMGNLT